MDKISAFRAFVRLVETGSFTAVARELGVKQSTVSKWLATLEDSFDARLIDRTTRSQQATESGQTLYRHALSVLDSYDTAVAAMNARDAELRGRIRLSLPVVFGRLFVVPQVASFLRRHPALEIAMNFSDHYSGLVDEGLDLAVRVGVPVDSSLQMHYLGESTRRLVASPGYLKTHGVPKTPDALQQHQCLDHTLPGAPKVWRFTRGKKSSSVSVHGRASADNSEVTLALSRGGLGICMLASWLVESDLRSGRLVPLLENYQLPNAPIRALTPPGRRVPGHVRQLIEHLRSGLSKSLNSA